MSPPSPLAAASLFCLVITVSLMTSLAAGDSVMMAAIQPPQRPENFRNMGELNKYLDKLKKYYTIIGRPRFGKRAEWESDAEPYLTSHRDREPHVSSQIYEDPRQLDLLMSRLLGDAQRTRLQEYDEDLYRKRR